MYFAYIFFPKAGLCDTWPGSFGPTSSKNSVHDRNGKGWGIFWATKTGRGYHYCAKTTTKIQDAGKLHEITLYFLPGIFGRKFHDMNHGMVTRPTTWLSHYHWVFGMLNDLNSCCCKLWFCHVKLHTTRSFRTVMSCRPQNYCLIDNVRWSQISEAILAALFVVYVKHHDLPNNKTEKPNIQLMLHAYVGPEILSHWGLSQN